jgi:hypothetical protein
MGQVFYYRQKNPHHIEEVVTSSFGSDSQEDDENTPLIMRPKQSPHTRSIIRIFFVSSVLLWVGLLVGSAYLFSHTQIDYSQLHVIPQLFGWASAILYCASRIPQIMQNFRNESVEGLSLVMFIFSVVGNLTYCVVNI